jgi:hypothetical protein
MPRVSSLALVADRRAARHDPEFRMFRPVLSRGGKEMMTMIEATK